MVCNMKRENQYQVLTLVLFLWAGMMLVACNKDFLDENPRTDQIIPSTLSTIQALLDNDRTMNLTPTMGELSSDDYYLTFQYYQAMPRQHERNCYTWKPDIFGAQQNVDDWSRSYTQVLYANVALEGLEDVPINTVNRDEWNAIKGSALFFRAYAYFNLVQIFAKPYDSATAGSDEGIPLRKTSDINETATRSSVQDTYFTILQDLDDAENLLLPVVQYLRKNRPSKTAVLALKARIFLSMRAYSEAGQAADEALRLYDSLMDYNSIDRFSPLPFKKENSETIFQSQFTSETNVLTALIYPEVIIDSVLLNSYDVNDYRKSIYYTNMFSGNYNLKGSYAGSVSPFSGLATDELYLTRAECAARAGNSGVAMNDLNKLLQMRWKTGTYIPMMGLTPTQALDTILAERRKELAFRGLRWIDLRRLNKEGRNITPERNLNNEIITLPANSNLYVLPIPPEVVRLGNLVQNQR
jgi:starch-binding outer membrane protein, SusD/RagB family